MCTLTRPSEPGHSSDVDAGEIDLDSDGLVLASTLGRGQLGIQAKPCAKVAHMVTTATPHAGRRGLGQSRSFYCHPVCNLNAVCLSVPLTALEAQCCLLRVARPSTSATADVKAAIFALSVYQKYQKEAEFAHGIFLISAWAHEHCRQWSSRMRQARD